jgi:hypothetical protein
MHMPACRRKECVQVGKVVHRLIQRSASERKLYWRAVS